MQTHFVVTGALRINLGARSTYLQEGLPIRHPFRHP